ncbi:cellulase family glycosylhydrolase [Marinicellulosiphila megalodicopiae]|uniref:cellulase family glycosylhydrolase n=1 Tax=Marinicellulosiphila megalodicopiae TaxID=2724896 RepID=UPI003BB0BA0F
MIFNKTILVCTLGAILALNGCTRSSSPENTPPTIIMHQSNNLLTAIATDSDNDPLTYTWTVNGQIQPDTGRTISLPNSPGDVLVSVDVSDGKQSVNYTETITIEATAPLIPVAKITPSATTGQAPMSITFDGTGSTDDVGVIGYQWSINGETLFGGKQTYKFEEGGQYVITLTVEDGDFHTNSTTTTINLTDANAKPTAVAIADKLTGSADLTVNFDASSSDDGGVSGLTYLWDINGTNIATTAKTDYEFTVGGEYIVTLTVTDMEGLFDTDTVTINVLAENGDLTAVANANVLEGEAPLTVTFNGSSSTNDGDLSGLTYDWVIGGDSLPGEIVNKTFTTPGTYNAQLTVTDAQGNQSIDSISIKVTPANQKPNAVAAADITSGDAPQTVYFTSTDSDDDNGIVAFSWVINGQNFNGPTAAVTFSDPGTYTATLTVEDAAGKTDSDSINVVLRDPTGAYNGELPVPQDLVDDAIEDSMQSGELRSGNVIYTKIPYGESPLDYPTPRVVTIDENGGVVEYNLPAHHVFDFGNENKIVLDDFNDADHQNNLGGAVAINYCENYTEGGGYWYVFGDDATTITNASGLAINPYNIIEAVERGDPNVDQDRYALHVKMQVSEYAGVGTNILFEEHEVDLTNLDYIEITVKGSGEFVPMLEPIEAYKPDWGNYAAYDGALGSTYSLSSTYQTIRLDASDFVGEEFSNIEGESFVDDGKFATKFFFQSKTPGNWEMYIDRIEFFGTGLNVDSFAWKNDEYDADCEGADVENQDVPTLIENPYIDFSIATITEAGTQVQADVKTANELLPNGNNNWLHVGTGPGNEARRLYDSNGDMVRLTGVNWFGFETKNLIPMGIWEGGRTYEQMLDHIKLLKFNTVRIPFSDEVIKRSLDGDLTLAELDIDLTANGMNASQTPLDLMDAIIEYADDIGLKVVLDSHSRASDRYLVEGHWVSEFGTEQQWIDTWKELATRYQNQDAVIAFDLNNEPHFEAAWGSADPSMNWNSAAERAGNAIQQINPNVLIIVEGVEHLNGHQEMDDAQKALDSYWWGGNLKGVRDYPINFAIDNSKLVYSPHEYGPEVYVQPWFKDSSFPRNLQYIWEDRFGYIYNESFGHMFIGEFGIKNDIANSASNKWFESFVEYMCDRSEGFSFTYWAWNPNSGDTGGILGNDWESVNTWKMDYLESCLAPMIGNDNAN